MLNYNMEFLPETILCRCFLEDGSSQFEKAMQMFLKNPHFVNRRLSAAIHLSTENIFLSDGRDLLRLIMDTNWSSEPNLDEIMKMMNNAVVLKKADGSAVNIKCSSEMIMTVQKLLPRSSVFKEVLQIVLLDKTKQQYFFICLPSGDHVTLALSPVQPYSLRHVNNEMLLTIFGKNMEDNKSIEWLKSVLFPKLQQWSKEMNSQSSQRIQSLSLISLEKYVILYQKLKAKYGQKLVEIWPEKTDPKKFVYEDIAIASYLLLLWEVQRMEEKLPEWQQSFVDVGCGNGLLVYILSSEGHQGLGVDIRKRGIWDMYPKTTELKVQTFIPSDSNLFPWADWIIGNHSDELTPWIPVIAARSSYKCNFFLLPCCAYDFNGQKYQRLNSSQSQYSEYLDYVKNICEQCGFNTNFDRLKIPSTKRICLVGTKRNYPESIYTEKRDDIMEFVERGVKVPKIALEQTNSTENSSSASVKWNPHFKARESKEKVRNCTQLERGIVENVIALVVQLLLAKKCFVPLVDNKGNEKLWNEGGTLSLHEVASSLPQSLLMELKKECGGLQTLLKNNHEIFCVFNGSVKISFPLTIQEKTKIRLKSKRKIGELKLKKKPCWFFNFHPDGCPLKEEECSFYHYNN